MEIKLKTKIEKQLIAASFWVDGITEQILYGGAKGGGKSYLGASLIFGDALIYPETHYFIARQELTDLRKFTIPTIQEVFHNWELNIDDYSKFDGQYNVFTLHNGSKVFLIACKELPSDLLYERFGSMQNTRGWIEEGGEVAKAAAANLWLSVGRWKNDEYNLKKKMLITANPKRGWMKRDFVDPFKTGLLTKDKQYIQAFATDNKYLSQDYIETLRNEKNKVRRQRLFLGDWDYNETDDGMVFYDFLSDSFTNTIVKDNNRYLVVDVARLGRDSTVMSFWEGLELYKIEKYQKQDIEKTKQKIRDFAAIEKIPYSHILVDEDGVGGGVVDGLFGIKGFVANSTPIPTALQVRMRQSRIETPFVPKTNFANLKSQCGFKLAELINEHRISFKTPDYRDEIIEDLTSLLRQKDFDKDGRLQLVPKDDARADLGRSPDVGDTLIMRMFFELQKTASNENPERRVLIEKQKQQFSINKSKATSSTR